MKLEFPENVQVEERCEKLSEDFTAMLASTGTGAWLVQRIVEENGNIGYVIKNGVGRHTMYISTLWGPKPLIQNTGTGKKREPELGLTALLWMPDMREEGTGWLRTELCDFDPNWVFEAWIPGGGSTLELTTGRVTLKIPQAAIELLKLADLYRSYREHSGFGDREFFDGSETFSFVNTTLRVAKSELKVPYLKVGAAYVTEGEILLREKSGNLKPTGLVGRRVFRATRSIETVQLRIECEALAEGTPAVVSQSVRALDMADLEMIARNDW